MNLDPREEQPIDPNEILTEDSSDELADLEKEFEARKARLLAKREKKKDTQSTQPHIYSTTPKSTDSAKASYFKNKEVFSNKKDTQIKDIPVPKEQIRSFQKIPTSSFANKLQGIESIKKPEVINYKERFFEFEGLPPKKILTCSGEESQDDVSGEVLSRRYLEDSVLKNYLGNVKVLRATKLLAKVYPPKFEEPNYINWCLAGILMHKSEPKTTSNNSKYMALRIGLFSQTVDVMLFGDAFKKYWKLQCGDVVVVLNPSVKGMGKRFSLSLRDDLETIIEVGTLKNYGRCSAKTTQGEPCKYIVDSLKNELCSYHEESKFKQRSRMELQGSIKPKAPRDKNGNLSQMYFNKGSQKPLYIGYESSGIHEKDVIYTGGEQFDELKYDRPVIESASAKLRKQKANQKLRLQLLMRAVPARVEELQKLGIVDQVSAEKLEEGVDSGLHSIRLQAFHREFIKSLGYDPVAATMSSADSNKKTTSSKTLEELRALSSSKVVSLEASKKDHTAKMLKRKRALRILEPKKTMKVPTPPLKPISPTRSKPQIMALDDDACDNDSDIEISFACEKDKSQYEKVCIQVQTMKE